MSRATEHGEIWEARVDKLRPVAIVSRDDVRGRRAKTTVASITTTIRGLQTEVFVDHRDGLEQPSAVNCDELNAIPKEWLVRRVGRLSATKIDELDDALRFALQLR
jgi:mRNA interferase MazF